MLTCGESTNLHMHTLNVSVVNPDDPNTAFTFDTFRQTVAERLRLLDPLRFTSSSSRLEPSQRVSLRR